MLYISYIKRSNMLANEKITENRIITDRFLAIMYQLIGLRKIKTKKQQAETAQSPIPGNRTPPACLYLIYRYLIYCYFIYCNLIYRNLITVSHSIIICDLLYDFLLFTELFVDRILRTDFRHFGSDVVGLVLKISRSQPDAFCDLFHILFL